MHLPPSWPADVHVERDNSVAQGELPSLLALAAQRARGFDGALPPPAHTHIAVGPPGSVVVGGARLGEGAASDRILKITVGGPETFVSTDRAALPRGRRGAPVVDSYQLHLRRAEAGWDVLWCEERRKRVPTQIALASMAAVEGSAPFKRLWQEFAREPVATRLGPRPAGPPPSLLDRLRGRVPPPPLPPPDRQLKYVLEGWLPPGTHNVGALFVDPRELAQRVLALDAPALCWTVELWEKSAPRYVHWHFRGTLVRCIHAPPAEEPVVWQMFRV